MNRQPRYYCHGTSDVMNTCNNCRDADDDDDDDDDVLSSGQVVYVAPFLQHIALSSHRPTKTSACGRSGV